MSKFSSIFKIINITILVLLINGCTVIAPFDPAVLNQSYKTRQDISVLYALLVGADPNERGYRLYRRDYARIDAGLQSILNRQKNRPKNAEATEITEEILNRFRGYRDEHKRTNAYSKGKASIHAKKLNNLMGSLIFTEEVRRPRKKR